MTPKLSLNTLKLAAAALTAAGLLWAFWVVVTRPVTDRNPSGPRVPSEIRPAIADTEAPRGAPPGRWLTLKTSFNGESGPLVAGAWGDEPCWPQPLAARTQESAGGSQLNLTRTWAACVVPGNLSVTSSVWAPADAAESLAPDAMVLSAPLSGLEQATQGELVAFAVGYCTEDGWCSAAVGMGPTRHPASLSARLQGRAGPASYVQAEAPPATAEWDELSADEPSGETEE